MLKSYGYVAIAFFILSAVGTGAVWAQQAVSYVSASGSDSNACTLSQPCSSLAGALGKTNSGGTIIVRNTTDHTSLTINKPISIIATGTTTTVTENADIDFLVSLTINVPNGNVFLKGLTIINDGDGETGISVVNAADVEIENVVIQGALSGLYIASTAATRVHLYNSKLYRNYYGVNLAPGSVVNGIIIDNSTFDYNTGANIYINGNNAAVLVGNSSIQGGTALVVASGKNPSVQSYGDNRISGSFPATIVQRQ